MLLPSHVSYIYIFQHLLALCSLFCLLPFSFFQASLVSVAAPPAQYQLSAGHRHHIDQRDATNSCVIPPVLLQFSMLGLGEDAKKLLVSLSMGRKHTHIHVTSHMFSCR